MASRSYQLVQQAGPSPGRVFTLTKSEIYLGRDINNDIPISDPEVSRKHARLVLLQTGEYQLEDLGSTNGTYIDGQRITGPHLLYPGEAIMLGDNVRFHFDVTERDPDATAAAAAVGLQVPPPAASAPPPAYPLAATPPLAAPLAPPPPAEPVPPPQAQPTPTQAEPKRNNGMLWVVAGLGCLVVFLCVVILAALAFDYLQLYCVPPFNVFFPC